MFKFGMMLLSLFLFSQAYAFPCFVTVMKDKCWANYNVTVDVKDVTHDKVMSTVVVPKGKSWERASFDCQAQQELGFYAQFSPPIWEKTRTQTYGAKRYRFLPAQIAATTKAWNVSVCYPADFAGVPSPAGDLSHCGCDASVVTPIPLQK